MSSELKVNKVSPESGTGVQLGDSGDTITIPSGATIANSGTATGFGGGSTGLHTFIEKKDLSSLGEDVEFTLDTSTYTTFFLRIYNYYMNSGTSSFEFRVKNNSSGTVDNLVNGSFAGIGRKHDAGSTSTYYPGLSAFQTPTFYRTLFFDMTFNYTNGAFQAFGSHLAWGTADTTASVTYQTTYNYAYVNRLSNISGGVDRLILDTRQGSGIDNGFALLYGVNES